MIELETLMTTIILLGGNGYLGREISRQWYSCGGR